MDTFPTVYFKDRDGGIGETRAQILVMLSPFELKVKVSTPCERTCLVVWDADANAWVETYRSLA